jgi:hypothetical protein
VSKPVPKGAQEQMFVAVGDQVQPRDFAESEFPAVDLIERDLHLQNVASYLGQMSQTEGLVKASHTPHRVILDKRYSDEAGKVVANAQERARKVRTTAKWEFLRAFGATDLGESDEPEASQRELAGEFSKFERTYGHSHDAVARHGFAERLRNNVKSMQLAFTVANRQAGERPHKSDKSRAKAEQPKLSTQERLEAVFDDPRAGFLPTSHREKNLVLTFLDYLDNPAYPLGINNQLYEVFRRRGNETHLQVEGIRAMRSIAYELVDYASQAQEQLLDLRRLQVAIKDCDNPFVTMLEDIGADHPGYAPLVRFIDLQQKLKTGQDTVLGRDVMRSREDRVDHDPRNKRKTVGDEYTSRLVETEFADRITAQVAALKIGEVRSLINQAIADQEKRRAFWVERLDDTVVKNGKRRDFRPVREISRAALRTMVEREAA